MRMLSNKIINILENNDFSIGEIQKENNEYYVEISQYTPAGEDWYETIWFNGTNEGFVKAVSRRYFDFDVDEEAGIFIEKQREKRCAEQHQGINRRCGMERKKVG